MPVQDLTPQLRTRLSRVERAVGLFVTLASLLMFVGFGYYLYATGQRKGWYVLKLPYYTSVNSATGLHVGDKVKMMGFDVGEITEVTANEPFSYYKVFIRFIIHDPYNGYIWDDSKVKVATGGFLGERILEVVEGGTSGKKDLHPGYEIKNGKPTGVWNDQKGIYEPITGSTKGYGLVVEEAPALTEKLDALVKQADKALPGFFDMTNQITAVLSNLNRMTVQATTLLVSAGPTMTNVATITGNLKDPNGSLGQWIIPPALGLQLTQAMSSLNTTLVGLNQTVTNTDNNVTALATSLDQTLISLATLTSNLNSQVAMNTNLVTGLNSAIVHADELMQGLKKHWLLRSAFKEKPEDPPKKIKAKPGKQTK